MKAKATLLFGSLALSALFPMSASNALAANCPASSLDCGAGTIVTSEPQYSTTCSNDFFQGFASYDLVAGFAQTSGGGGDVSGGGFVHAKDEYTVLGVPDGTPLSFFAELRVTGGVSLGCGYFPSGSASGAIYETDLNFAKASAIGGSGGPGCETGFCCGTGEGLDSLLRLPIQHAAGEIFPLRIEVGSGARFGNANVYAQLGFSGLPPGARVVSCQGFVHDVPIPAVALTWGRIKSIHR